MGALSKIESLLLSGKTICCHVVGLSTSLTFPAAGLAGNRTHTSMPIAVGSKAPGFTLKTKTADGPVKDVTLSDNFGKKQTVLLFFPAVFTSVCTQEMCDQTSGLAEYEKLGATVYGISVDNMPAQDAWAKQNKIGIPLLSDLNKSVTKLYDVVLQNTAGETSARAAFVIGQDGIIKYAEQTATTRDLPNFSAIKAALGRS
jgi:glutaredoxin-dependent peroxiredoxin